jgi:hypothetical protein
MVTDWAKRQALKKPRVYYEIKKRLSILETLTQFSNIPHYSSLWILQIRCLTNPIFLNQRANRRETLFRSTAICRQLMYCPGMGS